MMIVEKSMKSLRVQLFASRCNNLTDFQSRHFYLNLAIPLPIFHKYKLHMMNRFGQKNTIMNTFVLKYKLHLGLSI